MNVQMDWRMQLGPLVSALPISVSCVHTVRREPSQSFASVTGAESPPTRSSRVRLRSTWRGKTFAFLSSRCHKRFTRTRPSWDSLGLTWGFRIYSSRWVQPEWKRMKKYAGTVWAQMSLRVSNMLLGFVGYCLGIGAIEWRGTGR